MLRTTSLLLLAYVGMSYADDAPRTARTVCVYNDVHFFFGVIFRERSSDDRFLKKKHIETGCLCSALEVEKYGYKFGEC